MGYKSLLDRSSFFAMDSCLLLLLSLFLYLILDGSIALHCVKYPKTEFFLVRIFQHSDWIRRDTEYSDWIRRDTEYLSVFSPNAGKYKPEKTPYLDTFDAVPTFIFED